LEEFNTVTIYGGGEVTIRALQSGDANFAPALDVEQSFTVSRASQSIEFDPIPDLIYGDSFAPKILTSSNLPASLIVLSGPASIYNDTVETVGTGEVTIRASQPGDIAYEAAADVDQSFSIAPAPVQVTIFNTIQFYDGTPKPVTVTTNPFSVAVSVTYNGSELPPTEAGSYTVVAEVVLPNYVGMATDTLTIMSVATPTVTQHPQDITVSAGAYATFSVTASSATALSYLWLKDGIAIPGATTRNLIVRKVTAADVGAYHAVVSNIAGSVSSKSAMLNVGELPSITTQPQPFLATVGDTANFSVVAAGSEPLSYQWRKSNTAISGATSASLVLTNVQIGDAGPYNVVVSNPAGSVTSASANLTILVPPTITSQPQGQTVNSGRNATFSVSATGTTPLSYQWHKDGVRISGATSSALRIKRTTPADSGTYTVVVTSSRGSVTSDPAVLVVQ
jgi:hypothetical protein